MDETWKPATLAAQALGWVDPATGALAPSLHPSTTFLRDPDNAYSRGFAYGRDQNPTYAQRPVVHTVYKVPGHCGVITQILGTRQLRFITAQCLLKPAPGLVEVVAVADGVTQIAGSS